MSIGSNARRTLKVMLDYGKPISARKIVAKTHSDSLAVAMRLKRLRELKYVERTIEGEYIITELGKTALASPEIQSALVLKKVHGPEEPEVHQGTVLGGRYVLETLLGKGTYGSVWKATDKSLERTVAVKLLHGGMKDFGQLKTEGKALSALSHKNILVVHDLDSDKEHGWLIMELIDGPSLQEYLISKVNEGKWLPLKEACSIIEQCLEALEFAHDKNRVHGDIKPANIFLPKTGEVKLGDFGVAKILGGEILDREYAPGYDRRLGSSSYAAPEVLSGQPRDFQSDLFSVGVLAYVLLTQRHPFMHESGLVPIPELVKSTTYLPPKPSELVKDIPEKYENIMMRLLEKDKSKRYLKARDVLDEWREQIQVVQCPSCSTENPIQNKFCGQCGSDLRVVSKAEPQPEKDLSASLALFTAGRSQDAIQLIKQSLQKKPNFAKGWSHLGYMLNYERRYEEAEEACTKSIKYDSKPSPPYQTRGFARSNLGRFSEAISDFTEALERETDKRRQSMILYQRGYARKLSGDFEEALKDALSALELDGTNVKARALKESLEPLI